MSASPVTVLQPVTQYRREDVVRILHVHPRTIAAWQRSGLVSQTETFSFGDLSQMRRLRELSATHISPKNIRKSVAAMQKVSGMPNPLAEAHAVPRGSRIVFRHSGALIDPLTQQLVIDFEGIRPQIVAACARRTPEQTQHDATRAQELFLEAVGMESNPETVSAAATLYREVLEIYPRHAAAAINLGTICYNSRRYEEAERHYRYATEVDADYALAFFDLGNVLDELQRMPEAVIAYQRAIVLVPEYADAHYNLALAYERLNQKRKALRHWLAYVRLDPVGPWASHARAQARRILAGEKLKVVCRGGQRAS